MSESKNKTKIRQIRQQAEMVDRKRKLYHGASSWTAVGVALFYISDGLRLVPAIIGRLIAVVLVVAFGLTAYRTLDEEMQIVHPHKNWKRIGVGILATLLLISFPFILHSISVPIPVKAGCMGLGAKLLLRFYHRLVFPEGVIFR